MAARPCDSCKGSPALLFCRSDSAFLCGACDVKVHGANKFASRHGRVWVCEVCEQAPAAITCKADAATLCVTCDSDIHSANPLARRHERFAVVPFYESPPAATATLNSSKGLGFLLKLSDDQDDDGGNPTGAAKNDQHKVSVETPELKAVDYFLSDVEPYLNLDYASSMDASHNQTDHIVPVQTKAVSVAAHPPAFITHEGCIEFDFDRPKPSYVGYTTASSLSHSISSSEVGEVPDASAMTDVSNPYGERGGAAVMSQEREARLMRYREKRKNRKFEKTIRYASRKAYAETRPRIKGRFAKLTEMEAEPLHAAATLMLDTEYCVVPSF